MGKIIFWNRKYYSILYFQNTFEKYFVKVYFKSILGNFNKLFQNTFQNTFLLHMSPHLQFSEAKINIVL